MSRFFSPSVDDGAPRRHQEILFALLGAALAVLSYVVARWVAARPAIPTPAEVTLLVPAVRLASYFLAGLHRVNWRYASTRDALRIAGATVAGSGVLLVLGLVVPGLLPRVLLAEGVFSLLLVGASRFAVRLLRESRVGQAGARRQRALVVGAGKAGNLVLRAMHDGTIPGWLPVGILDDDQAKHGSMLHGVPVLGPVAGVAEVGRRTAAEVLVLAVPSISTRDYYRIVQTCRATGLPVKTIPDLRQILHSARAVARIEDVRMEDLLQRSPVRSDVPEIRRLIEGRTILVTGAAGSIGSELCRQVADHGAARVVCLDNNETGLFRLEHDLRERGPIGEVVPFLGDIRDRRRIEELLELYRPELVFHAAAYKHVPMLQFHPLEAIRNNVGGTSLLAELADREGVDAFVLISTDKAVNPTSVMGATKRVAERIIRARNLRSATRFCTIRFGNVLGSNGSVVELFLRQIREGRPVTVTHPQIERYFMTIPEAVHLVLFAAAMQRGGETFILDMGPPVKIDRLARDIIAFAGLTPDVDVPIVYTGLRPGEKLYEELWTAKEQPQPTTHPGIMVAPSLEERPEELLPAVAGLLAAAEAGDRPGCWDGLLGLVPSFQGRTNGQACVPPDREIESTA